MKEGQSLPQSVIEASKDEENSRIARIRQFMIDQDISRAELARKSGIKYSVLRYILDGQSKTPVALRVFTKIENAMYELANDYSIN